MTLPFPTLVYMSLESGAFVFTNISTTGVGSDIKEAVTTTFDTALGYPWITIGNSRPTGNAK